MIDKDKEVLIEDIEDTKELISNLKELLAKAEDKLNSLELELINSTPTLKVKVVQASLEEWDCAPSGHYTKQEPVELPSVGAVTP